jgi:peptide/nickel transport system substrate-binding protein
MWFGLILSLLVISPVHAKLLRWTNQGDIQTMDPFSQNEGVTNNIQQHIYERLVDRDENLQIIPGLAAKWQQLSATTWRFWLRQGVKFHDGAGLSAEDVIFSVERAAHRNSQVAQYARALGQLQKVDDFTVDFKLEKTNPVFLQHLDFVFIMNKAWAVKHRSERPLDFKAKEETYAARNANGTGQFILKSREPDTKTVLVRNPNYWNIENVRSNVSEIVFTPIKSDATRTAALLSGQVDIVQDPAPQDVLKLSSSPGIKIWNGIENRIIFLGFDQFREELLFSNLKNINPFKDKRVRQALYQAIDIEAIRSRIMRSQSAPTGCLTPSPIACNLASDDEKRLAFDLESSKRLLNEAGFSNGFELIMHCPNNRYINDEEICQAVAAMWSRVGIKTKVVAESRSTYFTRLEKGEISVYMLGWGGAITDAQTTLDPVLHSRDERTKKGYFNFGRYVDSRLDSLIDAAAEEPNIEKRQSLIREALQLHNQEVRHIPLHRQVIPWASQSNVRLKHSADNYIRAWWTNID